MRLRRRHSRLVGPVDQESPHLLERHLPDEILDVDPAVAEGVPLLVRLGDLGVEGDDAFEARGNLEQLGHSASFTVSGPEDLRIKGRRSPAAVSSAPVAILSDHVESYLRDLRPERSEVMAEMEAVAERDGVPIVHWETGRLLAALCRAVDPVVLEVGTAIGYSTLHMAEQLDRGRVVTLEIDPAPADQARDLPGPAGVAEPAEPIQGGAPETSASLPGPFGLLFVD